MWTVIIGFLAKGWERFLSVAVYLVLAGLILFACYRQFFHPAPTTTVQSGGIANTYNVKIGFGGCARIPGMEKSK